MPQQDDPIPAGSHKQRVAKQLDKAVETSIKTVQQVYADASATGSQVVLNGRKAASKTFDNIQRARGEDYLQIFDRNPLVIDSLSQAPLLENKELIATGFNLSWMTTTLWTAASGAIVRWNRPVGHVLGGPLHYGPGHVKRWAEINSYMDAIPGKSHRLKYGHSVDYLPKIVEQFGMEGVPAFFCHLLQDFTTVDGLPVLPNAWTIKQNLASAGISPKIATALVSLSASNVLAGIMIAATIWKFCAKWERDKRKRKLLANAEAAAESRDYTGAVENYKRALELDRTPIILIALGQVHLLREAQRPLAHRAFADAEKMLATDPARTIPYHGAQVSLRGIATLQALATADVIGDRYPEFWQEQVENLVNAAVHSFGSTAAKLERDSERRLTNSMFRPPLFSAAINHYLAARCACQYPLLEDRQACVRKHLRKAQGLLGRMAQQDESSLRDRADRLVSIWVRTILPEDEADDLLAAA